MTYGLTIEELREEIKVLEDRLRSKKTGRLPISVVERRKELDDENYRERMNVARKELQKETTALVVSQHLAIIPDELSRIGDLLRTQDAECTAHPMFIIEQKRILTGVDTDYIDDDDYIVWLIDDCMIFKGDDDFEQLEARYSNDGTVPEDCTRTGFSVHWEFVALFFTKEAADMFISKNGHKFGGELRMSIECAYRNDEYQTIRNWLMSLPGREINGEPA